MSHTFWQISLPSSHDSKVVKLDRNGYAIVALITKIVVSAITIVANWISWEIPKESSKLNGMRGAYLEPEYDGLAWIRDQ